jgi:hypothetical protein
MTFHLKRRLTVLLVMSIAAMSVFASQASARDRNKDGISDSWEKQHQISTKSNQAGRDPDHDGVNNKCEFQANTNPQSADSNNNGVKDGAEDSDSDGISNRGESRLHSNCGQDSNQVEVHSATIASFDNGVLSLDLGGGGTLSAPVSDALKCERSGNSATAVTSDHGNGGNNGGDDAGDDDNGATGSTGSTGSTGNDGNGDASESCTVADLIVGAKIHEAKLSGGVFVKIELDG